MGEFLAVLAVRIATALLESDSFMVLAHHGFDSIVTFLLR